MVDKALESKSSSFEFEIRKTTQKTARIITFSDGFEYRFFFKCVEKFELTTGHVKEIDRGRETGQ